MEETSTYDKKVTALSYNTYIEIGSALFINVSHNANNRNNTNPTSELGARQTAYRLK